MLVGGGGGEAVERMVCTRAVGEGMGKVEKVEWGERFEG